MTPDQTPSTILAFAWDALARAPFAEGPPLSDGERSRLAAHTYREAPALVSAVCGALRSGLFAGGEERAAALRAEQARAAALLQAEAVLADLLKRCRDERLVSQAAATAGAMAIVRDHAAQRERSGGSPAIDLQTLALLPATAMLEARSRRRGVRRGGRRPATTAAAMRADLAALKDARKTTAAQPVDKPTRAAAPLREALGAVLASRGPLPQALLRQIKETSDPDLLLLWIREAAGAPLTPSPGRLSSDRSRCSDRQLPRRTPCEDLIPDSS